MRYLSLPEVLQLYWRLMDESGDDVGPPRLAELGPALAEPRMSLRRQETYPDLIDKAAILGHSLIAGGFFPSGNQRVGHAAMAIFLALNGHRIEAPCQEQERAIQQVASGRWEYEDLLAWLRRHVIEAPS